MTNTYHMEPQMNSEPVGNSAGATPVAEEKVSGASESSKDNAEYQTFAILGYILPFLFFLPLRDEKTKNVPYVRFHANQQLILLVLIVAVYVLSGFLSGVLMMLGYYLVQLLNLAILALVIIGAMNAYKGEMKELPFIGQFKILK